MADDEVRSSSSPRNSILPGPASPKICDPNHLLSLRRVKGSRFRISATSQKIHVRFYCYCFFPQPRACVIIEKSRHSNRSDSERAASTFRHQRSSCGNTLVDDDEPASSCPRPSCTTPVPCSGLYSCSSACNSCGFRSTENP